MQLLGQFVVIALRHCVVVVEKEKRKARAPRSLEVAPTRVIKGVIVMIAKPQTMDPIGCEHRYSYTVILQVIYYTGQNTYSILPY